jgi:hypothetical protein
MPTLLRLAVLSSFLVCPLPVSAATYSVWQGDAIVTAASPACTSAASERAKIRRGEVIKTVVRPELLADNGNGSRIAFIHNVQSEFAMSLSRWFEHRRAGHLCRLWRYP